MSSWLLLAAWIVLPSMAAAWQLEQMVLSARNEWLAVCPASASEAVTTL